MADTNTPADEQQTTPPAPETPPTETETPPAPEGTEETVEEQETEEQPKLSYEDLQTELTRVRQEAAQRRIEARDLKEQLANARTPEEFAAVQGKVAELERAQTVRDIADTFKLPRELREVLKGDTEDELKAHAAILAKFAPADEEPPPPFLGGGLDPNDSDDDDINPAALAKSLRRKSF